MKNILVNLFCMIIIGCNAQPPGPGYDFGLFDNTPNQALASAVNNENIDEIKKIAAEGNIKIDMQEPKFGNLLLMLAVGNEKINSVQALLEAGANICLRDFDNNAPINEASKLFLRNSLFYFI